MMEPEEEEWAPVQFFCEDVDFEPAAPEKLTAWIERMVQEGGKELVEINYIFCSDEYLYQMNVEYLAHDTYTDIITFDNSEYEEEIEGDIFISIDRVAENAKELGISFDRELQRVLAHGVLHLLGQGDKTEAEAQQMRQKEDFWLEQLQ
jgi:rRNA maturation RNase YbeY